MQEEKKEWFETWFDSPYYHILYKHRDYDEAKSFVDRLIHLLKPKPSSSVLDLACGKGRHALQLSESNLQVTGLDLSPNSIQHARQFEKSNLRFDVHDMRFVYQYYAYDFIFSLFTSFGYFSDVADNLKMLQAVSSQLKSPGTFVLDYLNGNYVQQRLVAKETKEIDGIVFKINRAIEDGRVVKTIEIEDGDTHAQFQERVQLFNKLTIQNMLIENGLKPVSVFGDYELNSFDENQSPRLIIISEKN